MVEANSQELKFATAKETCNLTSFKRKKEETPPRDLFVYEMECVLCLVAACTKNIDRDRHPTTTTLHTSRWRCPWKLIFTLLVHVERVAMVSWWALVFWAWTIPCFFITNTTSFQKNKPCFMAQNWCLHILRSASTGQYHSDLQELVWVL